MNLRSAVPKILSQRKGRALLFVATAIFSFAVVRGCQRSGPAPTIQRQANSDQVGTVEKTMRNFDPAAPAPKPAQKLPPAKAPEALPPISLFYASTPVPARDLPFLPSGTLVPCRLLITVDSSSLDTPIVGIVTEDVAFKNRVIIPSGTKVHAQAQPSRLRDRIACPGPWTFIFASGEELTIAGIALDRADQTSDSTDGSAGLRGTLHKADHYEDLKLLTANFLEGMTDLFKQRRATPFGFQVIPNAKNAGLGGAGEVLETYAERLLNTIETESMFVRVPKGKAFMVYLREPLRRSAASVAPEHPLASNTSNQTSTYEEP